MRRAPLPDFSRTAPNKLTFLVGAGGSRRAGLPTAFELVDVLLTETITNRNVVRRLQDACRPWHAAARHPLDYLRFETVMSNVAELADPKLELLRFIELAKQPSPLQLRLAELALAGTRLATVNFDDLLEQAVEARGGRAITFDAHARRPATTRPRDVEVLKLHGSLRHHRGGRTRRATAPLHGTLEVIASRSPGLMLGARAASHLERAVDDQILVVVGYSAADDLDVVPALAERRPERIIWIDHGDGRPRVVKRGGRHASPSRDRLLERLARAGSDTIIVRGPTEAVLGAVGLGSIAAPAPRSLPWEAAVSSWADERRRYLGNGMGFGASLFGELERYEDKYAALLQADAPRGRVRDRAWTQARRAYEAGETCYLGGVRGRATARRWAGRALEAATRDRDRPWQAQALLLLGRLHVDADDYGAAVDTYREAMRRAATGGAEWAHAGERCANALSFAGDHEGALKLLAGAIPVLRRRGSLSTLVDAYHTRGIANRSLGRLRRARAAFAAAAEITRRFPMEQQRFAATAMLGETQRLTGDLVTAEESLRDAIVAAGRASAYTAEVAMAHDFLARFRSTPGTPSARCLAIARPRPSWLPPAHPSTASVTCATL
ncbi:MAG TPA: SIR2 family protein [Solirubrobacteraceae bacterium]|jgi:tetratricopeptide (TPR) repeat protein